uniref:Uncharacterized protein n=1 Tax=Romanomermis culicivorax TaxID=13658 RepID=A0A915KRB6_ROMCU
MTIICSESFSPSFPTTEFHKNWQKFCILSEKSSRPIGVQEIVSKIGRYRLTSGDEITTDAALMKEEKCFIKFFSEKFFIRSFKLSGADFQTGAIFTDFGDVANLAQRRGELRRTLLTEKHVVSVGHPVDGKLRQEIAMQIDELDDQQRRHLHRSGAPQKDQK